MFSEGAVPKKCSECEYLFEGECTRPGGEVPYLHLDHGPCGIEGPTDPVVFENEFIKGKVEVPKKCTTCAHLSVAPIYGFYCAKDSDKWGDFHRALDWGTWHPEGITARLAPPTITTKVLFECALNGDEAEFTREYWRVNADLPIQEAKSDYEELRAKLEALGLLPRAAQQ